MGFVDRSSQFPNRVTLTPVDGQANTYDMTPEEGEVYQEGTPLDAENLTTEVQNAVADALNGVTVDAAGNLIAPNIQAGKGSCPIKKANTNYSVTVSGAVHNSAVRCCNANSRCAEFNGMVHFIRDANGLHVQGTTDRRVAVGIPLDCYWQIEGGFNGNKIRA